MSRHRPPPFPSWIAEAIASPVETRLALFLSDVHLGIPGPRAGREEELYRFLDHIHPGLEDLVLGGDVFEFWMEWRHAIPRFAFELLHRLRRLRERGVRIHFLPGNHDFALGGFLHEVTGAAPRRGGICLSCGGKRFLLLHGDGMAASDWKHRLVRRVLDSRTCQALYRILHPDLAMRIAFAVGAGSRFVEPGPAKNITEYRETALAWMQALGLDGVIHGHTHRPLAESCPTGVYINNGDWYRDRFAVWIGDGKARLSDCATEETSWH